VTDNGNYIIDLFFTEPIKDVAAAAKVRHTLLCRAPPLTD